jgi:hypothetical protein
METLKFAARPAVLVLIWIIASAHTISELSTVDPALRAGQASAGATAAPRPVPLAGAAALSRRPVPGR